MDQADLDQVKAMIQQSVTAAVAAACKPAPTASRAEIGSPEFAEDRTQVNSLNNKMLFDITFGSYAKQSDKLFSAAFETLMESVNLSKKMNGTYFDKVAQSTRWQDDNAYVTRYDLSNPNTLGTSDNVRGGVVPQNRAIDTATSQSTLNNTTMQTAIEAAVANALNGTIPTLEAAVGAAVAAALANTPVKPTPAA